MIGFGEGQMEGHLGTHVCLVAQPCPTLCDPMGCSTPGSSVHGIAQTRILEWVAISFSRGSSQTRDIEPMSSAWQVDFFLLLSHQGILTYTCDSLKCIALHTAIGCILYAQFPCHGI